MNSVCNWLIADFPSRKQEIALRKYTTKLTCTDETQYDKYLRKIHSLSGAFEPYAPKALYWQTIGFQNEDPVKDVRGGGILSLENIIYFLEYHSQTAQTMMRRRSDRSTRDKNDTVGGYPWAAVGINLTRVIATIIELIQPSGATNSNYSRKTYWNIITESNSFNRLYVQLFILLDYTWEVHRATYMDFPHILTITQKMFIEQLNNSHNILELERGIAYLTSNNVYIEHCDYYTLPEIISDNSNHTCYHNKNNNNSNKMSLPDSPIDSVSSNMMYIDTFGLFTESFINVQNTICNIIDECDISLPTTVHSMKNNSTSSSCNPPRVSLASSAFNTGCQYNTNERLYCSNTSSNYV
jgi:hypothetical protein